MASKEQHPSGIIVPSLGDLFTTQEEREEAGTEKIQKLPLSELHEFPNHPFYVKDDEEMTRLSENIKEDGLATPLLVRPRKEGGYEIVSGHRRKRAGELAGIAELDCIVRELDDDSAIIEMVNSNNQRKDIGLIEQGNACKMRINAVQRKLGRPSKNNCGQIGHNYFGEKTRDVLAQDMPESARNIQRLIRLTDLIPELQQMVDAKKLKFNPAVEISYLKPDEQQDFYEYIDAQGCTPSVSQAQQLKTASKNGSLTHDMLENIMNSRTPAVKPQEMRVSLEYSTVKKYFPQNFTTEQIAAQIIKLLETQYRNRNRGMER